MTLAATLPVELIDKILLAGATDEHYGKSFGAKCLQMARWTHSSIAPVLYDQVFIDTDVQIRSFLLALENDEAAHRHYIVHKLVRSLIIADGDGEIHDEDDSRDLDFWQSSIWKITHTLDMAVWKEIKVPMLLISRFPTSSELRKRIKYRIPQSTTLVRLGPTSFVEDTLNFSTITKLRFCVSSLPWRDIISQVDTTVKWLHKITHMAYIAHTWPRDISEIIELAEVAKGLRCLVVAINDPTRDESLENREDLASKKGLLASVKAPTLVLWDHYYYAETHSIYDNPNSEVLWTRVERELADPERKVKDYEELKALHLGYSG
jgi:hypothetical protein